jgi:hypothetical protein
MNTIHELQKQIAEKDDCAVSLDMDVLSTKEQIHDEIDEAHIIFLTDHLEVLQYEFDKVNADIYLLKKELKIMNNSEKYKLN